MIADQLGDSPGVDDAGRVLGPAEPGVSRGGCTGERRSDGVRRKCGESVGTARRDEAVFALVRELARGLEPLTCCFSAGRIGALWPGGIVWRLAW
jgi:hypothetical protein